MKNGKQTAENSTQMFQNLKILQRLKHIFILPTLGQKCIISVLHLFTFHDFQLEHPVCVHFLKAYKHHLLILHSINSIFHTSYENCQTGVSHCEFFSKAGRENHI